MTSGPQDRGLSSSPNDRFKELLELIGFCSLADGEVESKQRHCREILGGMGRAKTILMSI